MTPFSLLIKPTSSDCNMRCAYCFYLGKSDSLYPTAGRHRMSAKVLERVVKSYMETPQPVYSFVWQGGEPTLMGEAFFRQIIEYQKRYARQGSEISNGLQTNATLITDTLADHLARYRFLVGCSLDGPAELHDRYRRFSDNTPSHALVMRGIETLRGRGVDVNILVLVSKANVREARRVYRYLVDNGLFFHQYIPCVEFDENSKPTPFSISSEEWGHFLCELFESWFPNDIQRVSIRHFDALLNKRLCKNEGICSLSDNCCQYFVVEYNGDIYPCDFFVRKDLLIGNVTDIQWEDALSHPRYTSFGRKKSFLHSECQKCPYLSLCMGDCQKYRQETNKNLPGPSYLCEGWRYFFKKTESSFNYLEKLLKTNNPTGSVPPAEYTKAKIDAKTGRNQPCPCGSGKKYKKCCGR